MKTKTEAASKVVNLAEVSGNAKMWSPEQALEAIHMWERREDGGREHSSIIAGLNYPEHIALLTCALHGTIERWRV